MRRYLPGRDDWREAARRELPTVAWLALAALIGIAVLAIAP